MDFLGLSLRMAAAGRADYLPYGFEGEWSEEERDTVEAAIAPHVPTRVDSVFNNWLFWKYADGWYGAKRATWDTGMLYAEAAEGLAEKIAAYYTER